jgi:hypothetical protein
LNSRNYMEMIGGGGGQGTTGGGLGQVANTNWADRDHSHNTAIGGSTGGISTNHYHGVSGTSAGANARHAHGVTGTSAANAGAGTETRPRNVALLACIKY